MSDVTIDTSELDALTATLAGAGIRGIAKARVALEVATQAGATLAKASAPGSSAARLYPASITGDVRFVGTGWLGEFGPDKSKAQGALGNLFEYGSVHNAPMTHVGPAFDRVEPQYLDGLGDVVEGVL